MNEFQQYWISICEIYFLTKHYLLISEELSDDFDTFLQPLKEHRDAFDHITRVYGYSMTGVGNDKSFDVKKYQEENMKKAVGHVYRAFFDTADWLSYVCRKKIREILSNVSKDVINEKYPDYPSAKQKLNQFPNQIAENREKKDLSDDESVLIKEVDKYATILNEILDIYRKVSLIFA